MSLPIVDVLHKAGVPMLIPHSTNYKITLKGSPWVFRVPIFSRFSAAAAAKYTAENIGTRIAYIWVSDAPSQGDAQKFFEYIETFHGEPPVYTEQFQEGELDLRAHLLKIKALKPEALMISAQSQDFARGLVQSCEVGIPPSAKRIGGSAASNRPAPILSGDAIKGVFFRAAFSYADPDPKVKEFVAMTADRYGVANPDHDFSQAWDSVHVARIAFEGANLTLADDSLAADRTAIRDALWTVTGYVTLGGGVVDFRADPTPECRDGSKTPVLIEYTKGGEDYEIRLIGKTTFGATLLAGMVVGIPSFRLEGAYLALVTLGLGESVRLFISATEYLGATNGFSGVPAPRIGEFRFDTYQTYYYLVMPVMLLGVFFSFQILRSRLDRAFMAVREDPVAAAASGVNVRRHKMVAFMISAAYAGFAGALYAHMIPGYLNPRNFTVIEMVTLLLMVVLGGLGHIWGGIIGAIVVTIVYDITKGYYHYSLLMFGMVIVLTVLFMPKGIGGIIDRFIAIREREEAQAREAASGTAERGSGGAA